MGNTNKIDKKILLQWVVTIICTAIILFTYKEDWFDELGFRQSFLQLRYFLFY